MNNIAWPIAFAFAALCFAVAWANINTPPEKSPQIACFEGRGKWTPSSWGIMHGTCEFPRSN